MKLLPLLLIFIHLNTFSQEDEQLVSIQFIEDNDSFPDCKTLYFGNGRTKVVKRELPEINLPNTIPVNPLDLIFNNRLNFHSYASEIEQYGSIEMDADQIVPYSRQDVIDLILATADSSQSNWLMHDEKYLWDHFKILFDAKPAPVLDQIPKRKEEGPESNHFPHGTISGGIIGGAFIEDRGFIRIEPMQYNFIPAEYRSRFDSVPLDKSTLDSLLNPFYFSNYEVTNGEYREFINWVSDSVELQMAYQNLPGDEALLLLNCSNKERKLQDSTKRAENSIQFGLSLKNKKKIDALNWHKATEMMYRPRTTRYYRRPEKDVSVLLYKLDQEKQVSIYPDTLGFHIEELGYLGDYLGNLSWHPAYANYPVVNLNSDQIMAYCHWKQGQLNEEFESKGYKITVRPPTITEYEFATKAALGTTAHYSALDQENDKFITSTRIQGLETSFYKPVIYNPFKRMKNKKSLEYSPFLDYNLWYGANQTDSPVKFLNGNVSEFVMDEVTRTKWQHFNITSPFPKTNANFVLGSNYLTDVKTYTDDQYNAIFYKSALENGKSSALIGFRLVYLTTTIPER